MRKIPFACRRRVFITIAAVMATGAAHAATEDIAFVAEHLPEVAMDNRYAELPLWGIAPPSDEPHWQFGAGLGYTRLSSSTLTLRGPMFTLNADHQIGAWRLTTFVFHDALSFSGARDLRPLGEPFVVTPLTLPAPAEFTNLGGTTTDSGAGFGLRRHLDRSWLGALDLSAGVLWQQVKLGGYRVNYRVLDGPDANATGFIDFSASYAYLTPFLGIGKSWTRGRWNFAPHALYAMPLPRRAMEGRISGPGFDLSGNTETFGAGKHFGDPSVTLGLNVTYLPWHLTVDAGSLVAQALVEPVVHEGIGRNWVLQFHWEIGALPLRSARPVPLPPASTYPD
jgi:hypothetical protein